MNPFAKIKRLQEQCSVLDMRVSALERLREEDAIEIQKLIAATIAPPPPKRRGRPPPKNPA